MSTENDSEEEKENEENENNENSLNENINELLPKILEKAVEILNDTGNKIQFFKKTLHQIDESVKNNHKFENNNENEKTNNIIDLRSQIDKKTITDLLKKEKEIFCNLIFLDKIFPSNMYYRFDQCSFSNFRYGYFRTINIKSV